MNITEDSVDNDYNEYSSGQKSQNNGIITGLHPGANRKLKQPRNKQYGTVDDFVAKNSGNNDGEYNLPSIRTPSTKRAL